MPLAIVGPKNHVSAQSQSVFQDLEKEMLFFFFTPMKFWNFRDAFLAEDLGADEAQSTQQTNSGTFGERETLL